VTDDEIDRDTKYLALHMHDGLRFTHTPLTDEQRQDLMDGLRLIILDEVNLDAVRDHFKQMLDHKWTTTAPFDPKFLSQ